MFFLCDFSKISVKLKNYNAPRASWIFGQEMDVRNSLQGLQRTKVRSHTMQEIAWQRHRCLFKLVSQSLFFWAYIRKWWSKTFLWKLRLELPPFISLFCVFSCDDHCYYQALMVGQTIESQSSENLFSINVLFARAKNSFIFTVDRDL